MDFCMTLTSNPLTARPTTDCAARPLTELRVHTPVGLGFLNQSSGQYQLRPELTSTPPLYALSGGAEWFVDPATGASYVRMPLTGRTPAQLMDTGVTFCVALTCNPLNPLYPVACPEAWFPYNEAGTYERPPPAELIKINKQLITSYDITTVNPNFSPTVYVYSAGYRFSVLQGTVPSAPSCCPVCGGSFMYTDQAGYEDGTVISGGGTYSTCASTVSTTGCVNALTNGCRFSTDYVNQFALKNPQGCFKCTTNAYGWCGTGSPAIYCCAV
ncbi:hypothetical protein HYH03_010064 [Edaphochlamys debaryana]|uniref:Uncharacterized protein n=1 Tax=Edaphochlamys debaryana TaxID=47281 RepID=A0A836BX62_9CHLO|nr:hypothetical protein HYH03_010064 [Edaphochlamys debaryana]|eukprot:KAG2491697.1 hypothetical protein HYH03_010064 [Edaphochlamys debaryana]